MHQYFVITLLLFLLLSLFIVQSFVVITKTDRPDFFKGMLLIVLFCQCIHVLVMTALKCIEGIAA